MKNCKIILLVFLFCIFQCQVYANDVNIATFQELINSEVHDGDVYIFSDDLNSDETIGRHFAGFNVAFDGNNHYLNGDDDFGGFVLTQDSTFNDVGIRNCKGQNYQGSTFAGAIFNDGGELDVHNSTFSENFVNAAGQNFGVAGALYNLSGGIVNIDSAVFEKNYTYGASSYGGAIANGYRESVYVANMTINNSVFKDNYAYGTVVPHGGAIFNNGQITINNTSFENNNVQGANAMLVYGGALYNVGTMTINGGNFENNAADGSATAPAVGGAIYNNATLTINNSVFRNNTVKSSYYADGAAIYNDTNGNTRITNSLLENNNVDSSASLSDGGAVYNQGRMVIENSTLKDNYDRNGELNDIYNTNSGVVEFNSNGTTSVLSGIKGSGTVSKNDSGILNLGGKNENYTGTFDFTGGTLNLLANSSYFNAQDTNFFNNINFNMVNSQINNVNFHNLSLNGTANIFADVNFNTNTMDTITADSLSGTGSLFVRNLALHGAPVGKEISIPFANNVLKDSVQYTPTTIHSSIYDYKASYNASNGHFDFTRGGFNSAILAAPIAAQLAGYLTQIDTYRNIFANLDMVMITPPEVKTGYNSLNKLVSSDKNFTYSPFLMPEQRNGIWFKPYSTFENVSLRRGPDVSNVSYGSLVGVESGFKKLRKNGWYALYGAYASYNGSHQAWQGNSIYNNGGLIGLNTVFYKGKFFSAWTANVGATSAEASTIDGRDNFAMLNTGIAQMTGYNFETLKRRLIIQPSFLASYSFINSFNYTTSSNVHINTSPLHALQLEPRIKFIGNFKDYLQPYISVSMVWNVIDHAKFQANDVYLPNISVEPFVQYGAGVQKRCGDRITGFFETMIRNGGRSGIALMFGLRISI